MNSAESIEKCLRLGADGTEMDIQLTKDCVLVLYHNSTLGEATRCEGTTWDKTWDEIQNCRYKSLLYDNIKLIRLSDLFEKIRDKTLVFTFECKLNGNGDAGFQQAFADKLIEHIDRYDLETTCLVESTDTTFLKLLAKKKHSLKTFLYTTSVTHAIETASRLGIFGITIDMKKVRREEIALAHDKNLRITLFNQQSEKDNLEAVAMNPDFIQTDKLKHLLRILGKE